MNADTARMNRFTLRFADAELEQAFAEEQARKSLRPIRIALVCAAAITLFLIWPAAFWISPPTREWMPGIVALVLATVGLCYVLTHRNFFCTGISG
ncbi:MAG: hypothetical protein NTV11_08935 [Rhodocyclales bacterium]|nr:hypothetical protein [Rhodocyclales bacterium]